MSDPTIAIPAHHAGVGASETPDGTATASKRSGGVLGRWDIPVQKWVDAEPAPEPPRPTPTPEEDPACVKHEWVKASGADRWFCPHCGFEANFQRTMSLFDKVTIPEAQRGVWRVERFKTDMPDFHSLLRGRGVPVGETFTRLMRGGTLVMSDTPAEMRDHHEGVCRATGSCLLNGLGIGMVLKAILKKPEVLDVTVVEISQDVLDMVAPSYPDQRVQFVCADAMAFRPPRGKRYQMVWHDIWDGICSDNLPQMHALHRKYGRRAAWQGSWCRYQCERGGR